MATKWGYKESGESRLFEVPDGNMSLPDGWSEDHMVIAEPEKRTAEAITAAAGTSVMFPVKVVPPEDIAPPRRGPPLAHPRAKGEI